MSHEKKTVREFCEENSLMMFFENTYYYSDPKDRARKERATDCTYILSILNTDETIALLPYNKRKKLFMKAMAEMENDYDYALENLEK